MRPTAPLLLLVLAGSEVHAERRLTLADAVVLALRTDPTVAEAKVAEDRSKLAVLRAQLDRVSVRVDGQVQELWNKTNIGGSTLYDCTVATPPGTPPFQVDPGTCAMLSGTSTKSAVQAPSAWQGLTNLAANVNVPVFSGFRVEANVKRAQINRDAAEVAIHQVRKDTALAVARAYWGVRRLDLLHDVQLASIDRLRESEAVTEARVKGGLAAPIDHNRATLRRLQLTATLEDLKGQAEESAAQLGVLLGVDDAVVLVDQPSVPDALPLPVDQLLAEARHGRPEIESARLQAAAQNQTVRMARSGFFPQLSLSGLFQYGNNPFITTTGVRGASSSANPFSEMSANLTLGASLSMNFFDTLNTWTSVGDARYEEARLEAERRRLQRVVDSDVRLAHARLLHLYGRREPLRAAREVARDNLVILENRYKNGDALVIELLDAQVDLVNAEQQLVDVTAQLELAWLELQASLGRTVGVN